MRGGGNGLQVIGEGLHTLGLGCVLQCDVHRRIQAIQHPVKVEGRVLERCLGLVEPEEVAVHDSKEIRALESLLVIQTVGRKCQGLGPRLLQAGYLRLDTGAAPVWQLAVEFMPTHHHRLGRMGDEMRLNIVVNEAVPVGHGCGVLGRGSGCGRRFRIALAGGRERQCEQGGGN